MRRLVALLTLLAATAGCGATSGASSTARAQTPGVQLHPLWEGVEPSEIDRDLDAARGAGARMIRVDVGWSSLEQRARGRREGWYLRRIDAVVAKARSRGLRVLLTFMSTPCWASSAPEGLRQGCRGAWWDRGVQHYAPRDTAAYAAALAFLVRRYGARVAGWEVWNEPNQEAFFDAPDPARAYAALLRRAYRAVKRADRRAVVVGGALAEADAAFTDRLYRHGIRGHFDAWSVHPYTGDRSPGDPGGELTAGVPAVRRTLVRHGDVKPLWLTEFGWSTASVRGGRTWENGVPADAQARYLGEAFERMRALRYVDVAIWFNLRDTGDDPGNLDSNFGLLRHDGGAKPAYAAFRTAAARMRARRAR